MNFSALVRYCRDFYHVLDANRDRLVPYFFWAGRQVTPDFMTTFAFVTLYILDTKYKYMLYKVRNKEYDKPFIILNDNKVTGMIGLDKINPQKNNAEVWYWVSSQDEGKGVATNALKQVENYSINIVLLRKSLLERLVNEATSLGYHSFTDDILKRNVSKLKIYGYEATGFVKMLDSMQSYFEANMALLEKENRDALCRSHHVYTKVKDDVPAIYGLGSDVSNSLVADGCVIEGKVENSILFRGVHIGKGTVVKNCVLMQNTYIGDDVSLNCVVADKNVVIKPGKVLSGDEKFPVYIGKGIVI